MSSEADVRAHFRAQAAACRRLGSPFTACLLDIASAKLQTEMDVGVHILGWRDDPGSDALALRFAGGLHALVLDESLPQLAQVYPPHRLDPEALWDAVTVALRQRSQHLIDWLGHAPQTNEVGRSAILLPGMLAAARTAECPMEIMEIGSSAGLNLHLDRFRYIYGDCDWGRTDAPLVLQPEMRGAAPDLSGSMVIAGRAGVDLHPLNPSSPTDRLRLSAYVWPDQADRLARLAAALDVAAESAVRVVQTDAADAVTTLAGTEPKRLRLLVHSVVWQYLPMPTRRAIENAMIEGGHHATAETPLGWLSMENAEPGCAELRLRLWPFGIDRVLAKCDFHGRWIDWRGDV